MLQVIILAPTREIALQIHGVVSCIGQDLQGLSAQVFIGGTLVADDRIKAKKCHIAIGSPGRSMFVYFILKNRKWLFLRAGNICLFGLFYYFVTLS